MNKSVYLSLVVLSLIALMSAACVPPTSLTVPEPTAVPSAATSTVVAKAPAAAATPAADTRPTVPAPSGDARPLAQLPPAERNERFSGPAATWIKPNTIYHATIQTDKGEIVVELFPDAPQGVNNFVTLALNGYYDGLTFHRVEPNFVVQGGDPNGNGTGGPGYTIPAEIGHPHPRGAVAWARTSDQVNPERRSSGSQFYITLRETSFLDGQYSVFGQVVKGMEVVDQLAVGDKIQRIDVKEVQASQLPTPTPTPLPRAPQAEPGRPLAKIPATQREGLYNTPPALPGQMPNAYEATIKTPRGDIVIALDTKSAPKAVFSFVTLANLGFYDGMPVAFIQPDLYMVSGSPNSRPDSDVGYQLDPEPWPQGSPVITGTVALYPYFDDASGAVRASGSQFFISLAAVEQNDVPLSILGQVIRGLEIVPQLTISDTLTSVTIVEK
ncbi:MAG: peptidylprolyl isomerase [Anaerolineae bacterium]